VNKKHGKDKIEFVRPTISLPAELVPFIEARKRTPQHSGNLSSYIRSLIIADRDKEEKAVAA